MTLKSYSLAVLPVLTCQLVKSDPSQLDGLKQRYLQSVTAPLDGMWQSFVDRADHFSIMEADQVVGYCAVDTAHKLLQFSVDHRQDTSEIFDLAIQELQVQSAVVSTCEPEFLAVCRKCCGRSPAEIAVMYHVDPGTQVQPARFPDGSEFRRVAMEELERAVQFALEAIGGDAAWLNGYFGERIRGEELFGLWLADRLIARANVGPVNDSRRSPMWE